MPNGGTFKIKSTEAVTIVKAEFRHDLRYLQHVLRWSEEDTLR